MELQQIFSMAWRWAWLLVLGLILGAAAAYVASSYQTPVYQATSEIMVLQSPEGGVSGLTNLSDQELISTYIQLLETQPVLEETSQILGFPVSSEQLNGRQVSGTGLVQVTARDSSPVRAALIANQIVDVLIKQNETLQASRFSAAEENYLAQIAEIEAQIAQIEEEIASLQENEALRSEESLALLQQQLEEQRRELEDRIPALQSQIVELELEIEALAVPRAEVLEAQRQQIDDEILFLQSQIYDLELEIEALMPRASAGGPAPALTGSQREELIQKRTQMAQLQLALDLATQEQNHDQILSLQSQIIPLELEIEALMPRASSGGPAPPLTESQREELSQKQTELAQLQLNLERAMLSYDALVSGGAENQPLSDDQLQEIGEKRTELAQLQFELDLATQNYLALSLPEVDLQSDSTDPASANQQQSTLALYQQIYSTLLSNYESVRLARLQNNPNVVAVEPASPPRRPVEPNITTNVLLGAAVGLMVMGGIAFVIEYLDDTIRTPGDVAVRLGVPIVGYVPEVRGLDKSGEQPYVATHPRSHFAEAFRIMRTNLELIGNERALKTILIASPGSGEGKTTIASNLAVAWAQGKMRTILVDCDLRKPTLHQVLGLPNEVGLSDLLQGKSELSETMWSWKDGDMLGVITSGSATPYPGELITSSNLDEPIAQIEQLADVVILDGPPFMVADAMVLAAAADGVVLVIQPGRTSTGAGTAMLEQLDRSGANVIGVVFNRIPQRPRYYPGRYHHYYMPEYYDRVTSEDGHASTNGKPGSRIWRFGTSKARSLKPGGKE